MYAVVGCDKCSALWIVDGDPETSQCPRCGKTRAYEKRRKFVTTKDENHARDVRSSMLAARQGHSDAFGEMDSFAEMDEQIPDSGIDDETYLEESGLDVESVERAGEQETAESQSREEIVREALQTLEEPTLEAVVAYASEHGVSSEYTEKTVRKLHRSGEVTESQGVYRLL